MPELDQIRSQLALKHMENANAEVREAVRSLPAEIRINGVLAVVVQPQRDAMSKLLEYWLIHEEAPIAWGDAQDKELRRRLVRVSRAVYWQAQDEALKFATWLKRWADALQTEKRTRED